MFLKLSSNHNLFATFFARHLDELTVELLINLLQKQDSFIQTISNTSLSFFFLRLAVNQCLVNFTINFSFQHFKFCIARINGAVISQKRCVSYLFNGSHKLLPVHFLLCYRISVCYYCEEIYFFIPIWGISQWSKKYSLESILNRLFTHRKVPQRSRVVFRIGFVNWIQNFPQKKYPREWILNRLFTHRFCKLYKSTEKVPQRVDFIYFTVCERIVPRKIRIFTSSLRVWKRHFRDDSELWYKSYPAMVENNWFEYIVRWDQIWDIFLLGETSGRGHFAYPDSAHFQWKKSRFLLANLRARLDKWDILAVVWDLLDEIFFKWRKKTRNRVLGDLEQVGIFALCTSW